MFGRYRLIRRLAVGGMAEIFLASLQGDAGFTKQVVLKRILPHLEDDHDFVRMFVDEATLAAQLSHPNIVQVHDFGCVDGSHFIVMEHVEGIDLHRLLRTWEATGRRLSPAEVAAIGEWVARGLAYTHSRTDAAGAALNIVHRDVSPHNIMLSATGEAKVMDFGIAKAAARRSRTATGTVKGKLAYMSPEQARGQGTSWASDQFSLGAVLWEALSGRRLYQADSDVALMQHALAGDIPPLAQVAPHAPVALAAIVQRALSIAPEDRYASLGEMAEALAAFRFGMGVAGQVSLGPQVAAAKAALEDPNPLTSWSWRSAPSPAAGAGTRRLEPPAMPAAEPPPQQAPASGTAPAAAASPTPSDAAAAFLSPRPTARISGHSLAPTPRPTQRVRRRQPRPARPPLAGRLLRAAATGLGALVLPLFVWWHPSLHVAHAKGGAPSALAEALAAAELPELSAAAGGTDETPGRLSLETRRGRWTVFLGSQRLGVTPLHDVEVPAGALALRLVDEVSGHWRSLQIMVPAGGRLTETVR